jgi:F-type H+-transporting ATPase subunit gamma
MANLKAIRKRIASVKNTQKITKAMKMVSSAKLRRAQQAMLQLRPYAAKHRELLESLAHQLIEAGELDAHPLLTAREEVKTVAFLAISSDRGMCGAFNASIFRKLAEALRERKAAGQSVVLFTIGRRMGIFGRKQKVDRHEDLLDVISAATQPRVKDITARVVQAFLDGEVDEVVIISNRFKSALTQLPTVYGLLPVAPPTGTESSAPATDLFYEPGQAALLSYVVPRFVEVQVRQAILESIAGEHAARMNAMSSATDNANGMIQRLTLEMNRARQAAITKELMEIIGGAEAMK